MGKSLIATGVSIGLCFLTLMGCATKPTTADLMRHHSTEVQAQADLKSQLARDWDRGSKLVALGERRVKQGERRMKSAERNLKRAQDNVERGRREIAEGQALINESERRFQENFPELNINQ